MRLCDVAKLIRSKNAGPFTLTIDILFENHEYYQEVLNSEKISKYLIHKLYDVDEDKIKIFECNDSFAIKISIPRSVSSGGIGDKDLFAGQQHAPLVNIEI